VGEGGASHADVGDASAERERLWHGREHLPPLLSVHSPSQSVSAAPLLRPHAVDAAQQRPQYAHRSSLYAAFHDSDSSGSGGVGVGGQNHNASLPNAVPDRDGDGR
jgi:hypothetical protein